MLARRVFQSVLALALCAVVAGWLGVFYVVPALATMLVAMSTGAYVLIAVGGAVVWPVLAFAFTLHVTRDMKLRVTTSHQAPRRTTSEAGGTRVEDP